MNRTETRARIEALLARAIQHVPPLRAEALIRKWLDPDRARGMPGARLQTAMADAISLSADLLLSQPSASGATAIDRLAHHTAASDADLIAALRRARHRLLRMEPAGGGKRRMACDAISGEALALPANECEHLPDGTVLFARLVKLPDGTHLIAGTTTPLDDAAFACARTHAAAGATSVFANARWAEALYTHIVRHGTRDLPGVNRPDNSTDDLFGETDEDNDHLRLAKAWAALGDAQPGEPLLQQTRAHACQNCAVDIMAEAVQARQARQTSLAAGYERMVMLILETMLRRALVGSANGATLDEIAHHIDIGITQRRIPRDVRALFTALRQRLVGAATRTNLDDPALAALMQRIQGLRAKTVEQGCTEQEALAAAEKVAELLDRYGLSLGELDFNAQRCEGIGIETTRRRAAPIDKCIPTIAEFFDCRVWLEQPKGEPLRYIFFGVRADVAAAQYLYELVERAFETETNKFRAGEIYESMQGERRAATTSFQIGLAHGIADKLRTLQAARDEHRRSASGRDLVVAKSALVDDELAKLGLDLHKCSTGSRRRVLTEAYNAGQQAGQRFTYAPAITRAA